VGNVPVQSSTVAFYAYLGKNELNIGLHHSFIFDVVIANLGNGYSKHTGAFIAPHDGVYVLTLTIFPNRGTITSVHILRNSEVVGVIIR
jgi:fucose 4-O-acetylase-like acetyltransferase